MKYMIDKTEKPRINIATNSVSQLQQQWDKLKKENGLLYRTWNDEEK